MPTLDHLRVDGTRVPVEITPGPDRPFLFLPGYGVHPLNYREGVALLGRHFTVFTPDLSFRSHRKLPQHVETTRRSWSVSRNAGDRRLLGLDIRSADCSHCSVTRLPSRWPR